MKTVAALRVLLCCATIAVLASTLASPRLLADDLPRIQANSNREPAGKLEHGVLTIHLELRQGKWFPWADNGPSMTIDAFAEEGKTLQIPGPLIRVPEGTKIRLTVRNLLAAPAVIHGLHPHPGDAKDSFQVGTGETRELTFTPGTAGTYAYWSSAGGSMAHSAHGRPYSMDGQLSGAFIVDPPGASLPDRVFVLGLWRSEAVELISEQIGIINGKSWPYTERLSYRAGEPVRWRIINASDAPHPMHLHGSYYRIDSLGDLETDHTLAPDQRQTVVTHNLSWGETMSTFWTPPAGRWLFHCHLLVHTRPNSSVTQKLVQPGGEAALTNSAHDHAAHEALHHGLDHMGGLVLGITVTGKSAPVAAHGRTRKLRLLVRERPAAGGSSAGYSYQLEEDRKQIPPAPALAGPPVVLERGQPVQIDVVNQLHEPTTVHWHGMELQSFFDGVSAWDGDGRKVAPQIEPGHRFHVRFTPPRSGTFIYHTHLNDEAQLSSGLVGALIVVDDRNKYDPATDVIFLSSRGGPDILHSPVLLNGTAQPETLHWRIGQRYRLRLVNINPDTGTTFSLYDSAGLLHWRALAKDGADLPPSLSLIQDSRQGSLPGETYDFEFQSDAPGQLRLEAESKRLQMKVIQPIEVH